MRTLLITFCICFSAFIQAQTLYWVGGSGNFSDSNHWSLSSGGSSSNLIPNSNTDVIFDNNSGNGPLNVNFVGASNVKSFRALNTINTVLFTGGNNVIVDVNGSFNLGTFAKWDSYGTLNIQNVNPTVNYVYFGLYAVNGEIKFNQGALKIYSFTQAPGNKLKFKNGNYFLSKTSITSDEIIIEGNNSVFKMDTSLFMTKNKLKVSDNPTFNSVRSAVYAPFSDNSKVNIPQGMNFGGAQMMDNQLMAVCAATISIKPACTGTCTGVFSVTLDPTCLINPYNVIVTTGLPGIPDCANTATLLSGNGVPLTYSVGGACECPGNNYNIFILEGGAVPIPITIIGFVGTNFNFTPPSFGMVTISQSQPVCFAACNGTWTQVLGGGLGPYTINVTPPLPAVPFSLTAGAGFTMGGICAGVYTFVITDANGCVSTPILKTMVGPTQINPNPVITHISCFGGNNGSITISPTGGNPGNYTVNFSPGGTFTLAPGGTVSVTGQVAGATINVTVTGIGGCTVGTSVTFTSPTQLTVTSTQTNVTCSGGSNGVASVSVSGGVSPYTYVWAPGPGGNTTTINNLPVGTQTVTITNNGSLCVTTRTFNITGPNAWTITPSFSNVQCPAPVAPNGSATLVVSPGSGNGAPYGFTWSPVPPVGQGTGTVSGLSAGVYTATISDNSAPPGCFTTAIITITAPPAFTVSTITQSLLCFNVCNGSATVNVLGGTSPYTYTWTPNPPVGQSTNVISSLCALNYTVNITDFKGCLQNASVSITQPASVTPNITSSSVTCFGLCNGIINSTPAGGNAPYTFTLITPAATTLTSGPAASASFSNRCIGVHTLFITGATGCTQSLTTNILGPNLLSISIATTAVSCFSVCNGSLSGNVLGGTPGYTITWITPSTTLTGNVIAGQCAGNYTATVTDANGCTASATMNLVQPPQITATITPVNPSCAFGPCNGILSAVVGGGTPGYTLTWSAGAGNPNINRCAGSYTLTVTDAAGCTRPFTATLTAPPAMTLTVNSSSPACAGGLGSATITASGGSPNYTFQCVVPPLTTNTTGIFSGLIAGGYIVSVTDASNCPASINFNISNPPVLSVAIVSIASSCNACTGGATVAPAGGTPTYAISWTNSLAVVVGTNAAMTNLCTGPYTITVTDAAGCVITTTLTIVQTVNVNVSIAGSGILCNNACTGTAVATATGGTLPYTFLWAPSGQTTSIATGLCAGVHTVTVSDASLCSNTATINFANPPAINVVTSQTNVTCFSFSNGAISATATGGTGLITYSWMPGGFTTTAISNLTAGVYTLTVTDANGCSPVPLTFTITSNPSVTATFTATNPSGCAPIADGSICITPSGGNGGPYTQTWSPGGATTTCISGLGAGAYSVTITDGIGCTFTLNTSLTNPAGPTLTVLQQNINCFGGNTGGATVTASGVGPAYTFTWNPVVSFTNSPTTSTVSGLVTGTYIVAATGSNNCIATQSIAILQAPQLTVTSVVTNPLCNAGPCNGSITLVTSGGSPAYTFVWSPGVIVGQGTQTVTNLCAGPPIYTVTITDASLCVQTRTFNLTVPSAITLTATFTNVTCFSFSNGIASATASGGTAPLTYSWLPVGGFTGAITPSVTGLGPNVYTVVVTDGNTCTAQATVAITQPTSALTTTLTSLNASCSNSCNGTATILAAGGTPTYAFSWSGLPATTSTVNGLCAGNYTATVIDSKGCISTQVFTITAPAPFTATLTPFSPLCNGACTGSITSNLSGAQGTVSYVWSPTGVGPNPTGLCPSVYTLVATDASSCVANAVVTLTNPPAINANVTTTNPACNNFCNGVAVSSPSNATAPIAFNWLPGVIVGQGTGTISSLCAGPYTLNILDVNSCTATVQFTLSNPPAVTINPAVTPASCGFSNGVISLGLSGGTPSFLVTWQPGAIPNGTTASGLGAGVYTANITDINGCTNSVTIPLGNSSGPTVTPISSTSVACSGSCTGGATVQVGGISGGTPPYLASWLVPPAPSSVNPLSNLCAGTYTAQIVDGTLPVGCIVFTTVTISQPPPITITPSFTLPTCNGAFNGIIVLNTSGGTPLPAYTYTWSPQANATATLINAGAGIHTITIQDGNLCPSTQTVNLPATLNMTALFNLSQNLCFGNCLGSATITPSGGAPIMNVSWSNAQVGNVASNLCVGVYTAVVTDGNGCNNSFTTQITSPPAITATTALTAPSCSMCNGGATVTPGGGNGGPYLFNWTNSATTSVVGGLCAGLYQVLITDVNSCTITQNVMVSSVPGITGETFTTQNVTCAGNCNGSITVAPIGGAPVITYSWIAPASTSPSLTGLCAGVYFVQMTDALGCIRTASTSINAVNALSVSPFVTQPSCNPPGANGIISVIPSGGTPGYTVNWAAPLVGTVTTQSGLNAGVYSATITDAAGCALTQTFNLSNSTAPVITFTQTNINCFNACTGVVITETVSGVSPITFTWSSGGSASSATALCKGVVTLTITDGVGCRAFQSFTLTDRPAMQLSLSNTIQPKCNGDCDGQITLIPSGGTLPYTFSWSPGGSSVNPSPSLCAGPGSVTVYTGTVTDALGCPITETVTLINPPLLVLTNTLMNSSCSTASDGSASVVAAGGTPTFSFNWTGTPTISATASSVTGLAAGNYTIVVTDSKNCAQTTTLTIVPTITIVANAIPDFSLCPANLITLTGSNSIGANSFNWFVLPSPTIAVGGNTSTISFTQAVGTFSYVLEAVSTATNCRDTDMVIVTVYPLPFLDAGPSFTIPMFSSVTIGGSPTSTGAATYTWLPAFSLDNSNTPNPLASNTLNTTYTVTVVDLATGCTASDTMHVHLYPAIKIPNGFSPNGDNKNDRWVIDNMDQFINNEVEVYNRWGELLFRKVGYLDHFDGKYKGKDLPVGTYYYIIKLNHDAYPIPFTGPLTIFR